MRSSRPARRSSACSWVMRPFSTAALTRSVERSTKRSTTPPRLSPAMSASEEPSALAACSSSTLIPIVPASSSSFSARASSRWAFTSSRADSALSTWSWVMVPSAISPSITFWTPAWRPSLRLPRRPCRESSDSSTAGSVVDGASASCAPAMPAVPRVRAATPIAPAPMSEKFFLVIFIQSLFSRVSIDRSLAVIPSRRDLLQKDLIAS